MKHGKQANDGGAHSNIDHLRCCSTFVNPHKEVILTIPFHHPDQLHI
jgi:hypothetical protein